MKYDLEELFWADWDEIKEDEKKSKEIFSYIENYESLELDEVASILKLYNNPNGVYTLEFAEIIGRIYKTDKIRFIKALSLVEDEIPNLVYAFRLENVFDNEDVELNKILEKDKLSGEEIETANFFFKMYKRICAS